MVPLAEVVGADPLDAAVATPEDEDGALIAGAAGEELRARLEGTLADAPLQLVDVVTDAPLLPADTVVLDEVPPTLIEVEA